MRARDLNTLEAFLAEYSGAASGQQPVKPGNQPTKPVASNNQAHDNADIQKAERDRKAAGLPKDAQNTELQSKADAGELSSNEPGGVSPGSTTASKVAGAPEVRPATGAGSNVSKVQTSGSPTTGKGQNQPVSETDTLDTPDIDVGDEVKVGKFKNRKATVKGFKKDSHGQPVLKTNKGDQQLFKPRVSKLEPVPESDKKIFKPKGAFGRSGVKSTLKKKLPTGRLLKESDILFEIDYNSKDVIKQALSGPVTCGFEAELIFKNIQSFTDDDAMYGDYDGQNMSDRLAYSDNQYEITDLYKKFITDTDNDFGEAFYNYQMGKMSKDLEDEDWVNDFVNYAIDDDDIADYKQETLDTTKADEPDEYEERLEWEEDAWGRELAELSYQEEMQDYWMENLDDHKFERMLGRFEDNSQYGIAAWLESNRWDGTELWDRAHELLGDPEEVNDEENPKQIAYREVEEWLDTWASKNSSQGSDIEVGDYHQTTGHDGWRIEEDGSLEGDGQGFEVISPVYETPADMLRDLDSFIKYANQQGDVETNRSTGLHITMSYDQESDVFPSIARTKMYVLSGSDWVAKAWGREFNHFTKKTTVQVLNALKGIATGNASEDNIKTMDDMIERFDDANLGSYGAVERGSSLNFKKEKNDKDNNLVEFRAAGNDYLPELGMIKKDVVRNSALVQATYDPDSHNKEFAKKMYKMLQQATEKEFDNPDPYDDTRGLSADDLYRQNTGDRDTKVNDQELTQILMKYAHRDIQPATKKAISDFYRSLRTYNQFKNAPKDDESQKPAQAPEPEKLDPLWEDAQEDELYSQKLKADIANNLAHLMVKLALSPNADKMPAKEVMAVRRMLKQHNLQLDSVLSELETVVRNDNIPDARDKQDISRIYRRAGRLLGKDLTAQMPKGKNLVIPVNKVLLATHDSIREVMLGSDPQEEFIFMDKLDWQFALDVCDKINQAWDQWQQTRNNPNTTQQQEIEAENQFKKQAQAGTDMLWKRSNIEVDQVTGQADRLNKADYKPFKNGERLINAKDVLPQLEKAGVIVKDKNTQESAWESLMTKFEGKPLQEQLHLLGKLDKQKIDEAHKKMFVAEESVPDKRKVSILNQLFSEHFSACDIKKQMEAFSALPIPQMIDDFRSVQRDQGRDGCCRQVLCHYVRYIHPSLMHMIDTDFCDGKTSGPDKDCEPCNEAWAGDTKIKKTGQWASKTIAELQKLASALRKKESRTPAEQSRLKQINFAIRSKRDWKGGTKESISENLEEAKGIMGRVAGDKFVNGDNQLEFQEVKVYPEESAQYQSTEERDQAIQSFESQAGPITWTNAPNKGMLAFGVATLTDPLNNNTPTFWGRYFKQKTTNMMGVWQNNQVPAGWKVQKAGALKLDIGIDPQHLIKSEKQFSSIDEVIQTVSKNSKENPLHEQLVLGLEQIKAGQNPVFEDCAQHIPALRDYFGEIMGPCALMAGMVGGQAEDANQALLKGAGWDNSQVFWPQAMNYALVDSVFIGPDGQEVGISSKGGKGAKASAKNIADAIAKAPPKLVKKYKFTVAIIKLVEQSSAQEGPFRIAEYLKLLPAGLEKEIMGYVKSGKTDYVGLSDDAKELFNYGTPKQDAPGFNTGLALTALLAKKVAKKVNEDPTFSAGALSFLNQSSIVQLYCKMGKQGNNARVTGWDAIYPPNFKGRVVLDGSKNYYSSRIGGKFAFGFV